MDKKDKFRGCLIGGAVGDALGYAVEFMSESEIFAKYGADGISKYELDGGKARISDDTQMTMFTATALLDGITRGKLRGIMGSFESYIAAEYNGWYLTQTRKFPIDISENYAQYSWIMNIPEMFSQRAPGNTCLSSLESGTPVADSKGCGGIMRVAPIGLFFANGHWNQKQDWIDRLGAEAAAITHGHPLGYIPAAALVHIISLLVKNDDISVLDAVADSVVCMRKLFGDSEHVERFHRLMEKSSSLAFSSADDLDAIHQLGEGWVAEETLAIAAFCAIRYENDFESAIRAAVNHNGDSDSTGAVCGNILGARLGYGKIPRKFTENLEFHDVLLELADDLLSDYRDDSIWNEKYIHKTYRR
ncbi:MAG: ADP-ribosylglycohydrolase family protein [Oscillospiraceae bacterium]|nr:ADP-ribosylglycohydrolase family protein [Oscillospiraceae bacterium]